MIYDLVWFLRSKVSEVFKTDRRGGREVIDGQKPRQFDGIGRLDDCSAGVYVHRH